MLQSKGRWSVQEADEAASAKLAEALGIPLLLARLLTVRGLSDEEQAAAFLFGGTDLIHDPFLLDGMDRAVERIRRAIDSGEKIRIYGDYDADGVSSTSLMVHLLRQFECDFDYYIPHRIQEGYGLNEAAVEQAAESGVKLIVTVDTGISAVEQIACANRLGIDVVVTDHHEPPETLPDAYALVNPKKPGCPYPFKQLAGVGVALKLAQALTGRWPEELLEYAAIGTVADLMPLVGENRIIVRQGLERMRSTSSPGLKALLAVSGIPVREVSATHIGFALGPRINASGRLISADSAVRLMTTDRREEAEALARELDELNKERQRIVEEMAREAISMVEERMAGGEPPKAIVLSCEDWNVGVIGIVASRVVERFYRPTVILGIDPETGMAKGSARSIAGFDIYRALTHCHDLMDHFGGHPMAAGMTLSRQHLPELERRLCRLAEEWLTEEDFVPLLTADMECSLADVSTEAIRQLERLAPFGMGNPTPRLVFRGLKLDGMRTMGKEKQHLKLALKPREAEEAAAIDAVGFNKGELADWLSLSAEIDVLGEVSINEWNGVRKPQVMIRDLSVPHVQLFDWRGSGRPADKLAELCGRLSGAKGAGQPAAVLLFGGSAASPPLRLPVALWRVSPAGVAEPLNEAAARYPLAAAEDIVLYTMPDSLEQLQSCTAEAAAVKRYYAVFTDLSRSGSSASVMPTRDMFKTVYQIALALERGTSLRLPPGPGVYVQALSKRSGLSPAMVQFILDVFAELGLMDKDAQQDTYRIVPSSVKKDLGSSALYQSRMKRAEAEQTLSYSSAKELAALLTPQKRQTINNRPMMEGIVS